MYNGIPNQPVVRNMEHMGYPDGVELGSPRCPFCGKKCSTVYLGLEMEIIGCSECIRTENAWECGECFPKED